MTDGPALIDQLAALHQDAFSWAVRCHGGNADAAADALQEAYVKVALGRAAFRGTSSLKTWWFSVVRLTVLERCRGQQRRHRIGEIFREWVAGMSAGPEDATAAESPLTPDADQLAAALARLPPRQSEVLHLVFQDKLSLTEAAVVMRISVGSARQHYDRAKKRLRSVFTAEAAANTCDHAT